MVFLFIKVKDEWQASTPSDIYRKQNDQTILTFYLSYIYKRQQDISPDWEW